MRKIHFLIDDYGNLCRYVTTHSGVTFWYPAYDAKDYGFVMSCGKYDEWGSLL